MDLDGRRAVRVTGRDWSLSDGGETTIVINDVMLPGRGNGEHRVGAEILWPEVSGEAIESRLFTRDNWNYRE